MFPKNSATPRACFAVLLVYFLMGVELAYSNAGVDPFALHPQYSNVALSPDGKYLAMSTEFEGEPQIAVLALEGRKLSSLIRFSHTSQPGAFEWANNDRLVVSLAIRSGLSESPLFTGELYAINRDGTRGKHIFGRRAVEPRYASGMMLAPDGDDHILVQVYPWSRNSSDRLTEVVRVNINTGKTRRVVRSDLRGANFLLDRDLEPRFAIGADDMANQIISVKQVGELGWSNFESPFDSDSTPVGFADNPDHVYVLGATGQDNGVNGLYRYDLKTNEYERLFHKGDADVQSAAIDGDGELIGVSTVKAYPEFHLINEEHELAGLIGSLQATFPKDTVTITSTTKNNDYIVLVVSSPNKTPEYYLYTRDTNRIEFLFDAFPWVDDAMLAPTTAFELQARDGMTLYGYLTLPKGQSKNLPTVVIPHGGPHARDYWRYDPMVQHLATAGYAVLQVNFRGSTGYGRPFMEAGYGEWGRNIQHDIIDATRWAIKDGVADPDRIAIYGASFGGYSAVQAPILEPDLYSAAIAYVGVYDLDLLYTTGDIETTRWGAAYLDKTLPKTEDERKAQSPVHRVKELKTPLFIVHGEDDPRAAYDHALALKDALDEIDYPYEWLVKDGEGHGFYNVENRAELNKKVLDFLAKHLSAPES
ncbi:MAG: S9 family peptidase [Aequoribacter sp.]|uniref:S9 family peptidase n=2 Tax=Aequoribacter sp. TaxID=2847771 RepID=UPI003C3D7AC3